MRCKKSSKLHLLVEPSYCKKQQKSSNQVKWINSNSRSNISFSILLENVICKETWGVFFLRETVTYVPIHHSLTRNLLIDWCLSYNLLSVWVFWRDSNHYLADFAVCTIQTILLQSLMDWCYLYKHLAAISSYRWPKRVGYWDEPVNPSDVR